MGPKKPEPYTPGAPRNPKNPNPIFRESHSPPCPPVPHPAPKIGGLGAGGRKNC